MHPEVHHGPEGGPPSRADRPRPPGHRGWSRREVVVFTALCFCLPGSGARGAEALAERDAPKSSKSTLLIFATYLLHFARLTTYPPTDGGKPDVSPFVVGVIGVDPFGPLLDEVFKGEPIGTRPVQIRRLTTEAEITGCHLLYIGRIEPDRMKATLDAVRGKPILTMSAAAGFVDIGGMVGLREQEDKAVFDLNLDRSEAAGLRFDSRLLRLAKRIVRSK